MKSINLRDAAIGLFSIAFIACLINIGFFSALTTERETASMVISQASMDLKVIKHELSTANSCKSAEGNSGEQRLLRQAEDNLNVAKNALQVEPESIAVAAYFESQSVLTAAKSAGSTLSELRDKFTHC